MPEIQWTSAAVEAKAKAKDSQSQYLLSPYGAELGRSQIAWRRLEVSNNVPSNLTKGSGTNLSAVIYGNFADLLIGMFGQLEILVDPYTDFAKGTVGVRALQSIDIAVRHAESFAAMTDAIAKNVFGIGAAALSGAPPEGAFSLQQQTS